MQSSRTQNTATDVHINNTSFSFYLLNTEHVSIAVTLQICKVVRISAELPAYRPSISQFPSTCPGQQCFYMGHDNLVSNPRVSTKRCGRVVSARPSNQVPFPLLCLMNAESSSRNGVILLSPKEQFYSFYEHTSGTFKFRPQINYHMLATFGTADIIQNSLLKSSRATTIHCGRKTSVSENISTSTIPLMMETEMDS